MTRVVRVLVCAALLFGLADCVVCSTGHADDGCAAVQCSLCAQASAGPETHIALCAPPPVATPVILSVLPAAFPDLERVSPPPKA